MLLTFERRRKRDALFLISRVLASIIEMKIDRVSYRRNLKDNFLEVNFQHNVNTYIFLCEQDQQKSTLTHYRSMIDWESKSTIRIDRDTFENDVKMRSKISQWKIRLFTSMVDSGSELTKNWIKYSPSPPKLKC